MVAIPDYEQAGELKIGQVGIANLRVRTLDVDKISAEMMERVRSAPKLFQRAAVILDFGGLSECPDAATVRRLVDGLHAAGVMPVGLAYGTSAIEALSEQVGLPLLAKFRASYESAAAAAGATATDPTAAASKPAAASPQAKPAARRVAAAAPAATPSAPAGTQAAAAAEPGVMHVAPIRSGQQVYAQNRDLTVCATVGAGAEVIARALANHLAKPPGMKRGTTSCKLIVERVKKVIDAAPQRVDDPAGPMT